MESEAAQPSECDKPDRSRGSIWPVLVVAIPIVYLLSSGPALGLCFWLRERTGWDAFYWVILPYTPLFWLVDRNRIVDAYVTWWVVSVFDTVGPG